jgi:hypothetical protein
VLSTALLFTTSRLGPLQLLALTFTIALVTFEKVSLARSIRYITAIMHLRSTGAAVVVLVSIAYIAARPNNAVKAYAANVALIRREHDKIITVPSITTVGI